MNNVQLLGLAAGAITTSAFIPQIIKIVQTRSAKDISIGMFILFSTGVSMWLVYGLMVRDIPVICANAVALMFNLVTIALKLKYR